MRIDRLAILEKGLRQNTTARKPVLRWVEQVQAAQWQSIADVRRMFPSADAIKATKLTCFNIGGNSYRLITLISCELQRIVIIELLTHAQYSRKYAG